MTVEFYRSIDPVDFINSLSLDHNIQQVMLSEFGVGNSSLPSLVDS